MNFKHSGSAGDVIYSLPVIKEFGGGTLHLSCNIDDFYELQKLADPRNHPLSPYKLDGTLGVLTHTISRCLIPLLEQQEYIISSKVWKKEDIDVDLNLWRTSDTINFFSTNLTDCHAITSRLSTGLGDRQWLHVSPNKKFEVIFARSTRHRELNFPWINFKRRFPNAVFTGIETEHADFVNNFGEIPFYKAHDFLDLAQIIAGCDLFIGNQSLPYAIAEGLKVNRIQETSNLIPNCIFNNQHNARYASEAYFTTLL